jgi:hypothetical protein
MDYDRNAAASSNANNGGPPLHRSHSINKKKTESNPLRAKVE